MKPVKGENPAFRISSISHACLSDKETTRRPVDSFCSDSHLAECSGTIVSTNPPGPWARCHLFCKNSLRIPTRVWCRVTSLVIILVWAEGWVCFYRVKRHVVTHIKHHHHHIEKARDSISGARDKSAEGKVSKTLLFAKQLSAHHVQRAQTTRGGGVCTVIESVPRSFSFD